MLQLLKILLLASTAVVSAHNAVVHPALGDVLAAGRSYKIEWEDKSGAQVNLVLKKDATGGVETISSIASSTPNSGSYEWSVPANLATFTAYLLEIQDTANATNPSQSSYFTILAQDEIPPSFSISDTSQTASAGQSKAAGASAGLGNSTTISVSSASTKTTRATSKATKPVGTASLSHVSSSASDTSASQGKSAGAQIIRSGLLSGAAGVAACALLL